MRWMTSVVVGLAAAMGLAACGETPQAAAGSKADVAAYQGTGGTANPVAGWKAGDAASWEQQTRNRAQGQNEYSRTSAP